MILGKPTTAPSPHTPELSDLPDLQDSPSEPAAAGTPAATAATTASNAASTSSQSAPPQTVVQRIAAARDARQDRHLRRKLNFIAVDTLTVFLATFLANAVSLWLWDPHGWAFVEQVVSTRSVAMTAALTICWVLCLTFARAYSHQARAFPTIGRENILKGSLVYAALLACVDAVSDYGLFRQFALIGLPVGLVLMVICRHQLRRYTERFRTDLQRKFLVIGNVADVNELLEDSAHQTDQRDWIHAILITDPENQNTLACPGDIPVDSICIDESFSNEDFVATAAAYTCDGVWVASLGDFGHRNLRRLSWHLEKLNMRLYLDPMIEGIAGTRLNVVPTGQGHALYVDRPRFNAANGLSKRLFDIIVSVVALVAVSPILAITALAIKLEDGGPVFYVSNRIGYHGKSFRIFKFRSMHTDADARLQVLREEVGAEGLFKMKDDPRITKVGKFIRRTSIDELPQFVNALLGTMSVVGPRPHLQHEVDAFGHDMRMRMEVRPGITGLWQVSGRSDLSARQAEALDLYYVDNWSLALDARTILQTVKAVVVSRGAY